VLIDDDAMVLRALSSKLTRNGFRVTAFGDAESGIDFLLAANDVDLVYCDLMMPGMTGMELASVLAEKAPELTARLVFMTGGAFSPKAQDFVALHRVTMVGKPFDILTETHSRLG
jgi:CheY-like chemotaxis protein